MNKNAFMELLVKVARYAVGTEVKVVEDTSNAQSDLMWWPGDFEDDPFDGFVCFARRDDVPYVRLAIKLTEEFKSHAEDVFDELEAQAAGCFSTEQLD